MFSFTLTLVIFLFLLFFKAYTSILQRLFLYFTVVTLLQLACIAVNIELQFGSGSLSFCKWLGFVQHWAYSMNWLFSITLTSYLHFLVYKKIRGKPLPALGYKKTVALEVIVVFIDMLLPLAVLWIPFASYGLNGALCWTQHLQLKMIALKMCLEVHLN